MENKEITINKIKLIESVAEATHRVINNYPAKDAGIMLGVSLIAGMIASELNEILFGSDGNTSPINEDAKA